MQVVKLSQNHTKLLENFCKSCKTVDYRNNESFESMKWGGKYDLNEPAKFWGLIIENQLVSISGSHSIDKDELRCLFRSATLPVYSKLIPGLSKNHMNSIPFSLLLPFQIMQGIDDGYKKFCITTSHTDHDASGKMNRTHKAISLLSKKGIVRYIKEEIIYHVPQIKWNINLKEYVTALESFSCVRKNLDINYEVDYELAIDKIKTLC